MQFIQDNTAQIHAIGVAFAFIHLRRTTIDTEEDTVQYHVRSFYGANKKVLAVHFLFPILVDDSAIVSFYSDTVLRIFLSI